ncbi:hypothetical protein Hanom_Chr15g01414871 [Helianthus anomalus]
MGQIGQLYRTSRSICCASVIMIVMFFCMFDSRKIVFFSPDSMTSLPWDDRKSKSVARMKRAKIIYDHANQVLEHQSSSMTGIWRFRRTVHGVSYINCMFIIYFLYEESMFFFCFVCYRLNNDLHV